jgi:sugar (pentulose or hexulose) kinase
VLDLGNVRSGAIKVSWVDEICLVLAAGHDHLLAAISVGATILVVKVFYIL